MLNKIKYIIILILLIDSIIGWILELNELTYLLLILNYIILYITLIITGNNIILNNNLFILGIIISISFSSYNIIIWYICFELILIPMIYLISKGSGNLIAKTRSIYRFSIYTIICGLLLLIYIIYLYINWGNLNYYNLIYYSSYSDNKFIFIIGLIPYLIKLPIIFLHIWLPDTHGEACTSGSIYLAALLLKLGALGIIRWLIPFFPYDYLYFKPLLLIWGLISTIYASIITFRQIDLKKYIAYSSISHMGLILISLTHLNNYSLYGFLSLLISHGFISANLFFLIGILYIRTHSRYLYYFKGLASILPLFSSFFFLNLLINAALPPSLAYFNELHILLAIAPFEFLGLLHLVLAMFFAGFYSIFLFVKIAFSIPSFSFFKFNDLNLTEFFFLSPLLFLLFSLAFLLPSSSFYTPILRINLFFHFSSVKGGRDTILTYS